MKDWMTYQQIQECKRNKLTKNQASNRLGINYRTVIKYWDMTPEEFAKNREEAKKRSKKADPYKVYVLECLEKYPDMSSAQISDWIRENYKVANLPCSERSFRSFVQGLRTEYNIPKPESTRQYEAVEDPPMGKQAQVDMGEIALETPQGRKKKVYGFGMVLSHSRYKFVWWITHPWTTEDFIQAHIRAFTFFGGLRPREIVYDQDKILAVSENHGDIIYTEGFQNFINTIKFDIYLCRGADPESKGRIENVIKYAKHGFAEHRIFYDIDSFNDDCIAWLARTGNAKVHETTKKIPAEVFALEKECLLPVSELSFAAENKDSIPYFVRKDNVVTYKGNRYRVPQGTYRKGKQVHVYVENDNLRIADADTGEVIAMHRLCKEKGQLIGEPSRSTRDKSKTILQLEEKALGLLGNGEEAEIFLKKIHSSKPRYYRDQLGVIIRLFDEWKKEEILPGLHYCSEHELYSAAELSQAVSYLVASELDKKNSAESKKAVELPERYQGGEPASRDLAEYDRATERNAVNG